MPEIFNNAGAIVAIMLLPLIIGLALALIVERRRRIEITARLEARRKAYADAMSHPGIATSRSPFKGASLNPAPTPRSGGSE